MADDVTRQNQMLDYTAKAILVVLCASWRLMLGEPMAGGLLLALVLMGAWIYLVNRPNAEFKTGNERSIRH